MPDQTVAVAGLQTAAWQETCVWIKQCEPVQCIAVFLDLELHLLRSQFTAQHISVPLLCHDTLKLIW